MYTVEKSQVYTVEKSQVYTVETDGPAQQQIDALPAEALAAYAELRVVLETAPWSGRAYDRDNPQGALRVRTFGTHGMTIYLILEDQRRGGRAARAVGRLRTPALPCQDCTHVQGLR